MSVLLSLALSLSYFPAPVFCAHRARRGTLETIIFIAGSGTITVQYSNVL